MCKIVHIKLGTNERRKRVLKVDRERERDINNEEQR